MSFEIPCCRAMLIPIWQSLEWSNHQSWHNSIGTIRALQATLRTYYGCIIITCAIVGYLMLSILNASFLRRLRKQHLVHLLFFFISYFVLDLDKQGTIIIVWPIIKNFAVAFRVLVVLLLWFLKFNVLYDSRAPKQE